MQQGAASSGALKTEDTPQRKASQPALLPTIKCRLTMLYLGIEKGKKIRHRPEYLHESHMRMDIESDYA